MVENFLHGCLLAHQMGAALKSLTNSVNSVSICRRSTCALLMHKNGCLLNLCWRALNGYLCTSSQSLATSTTEHPQLSATVISFCISEFFVLYYYYQVYCKLPWNCFSSYFKHIKNIVSWYLLYFILCSFVMWWLYYGHTVLHRLHAMYGVSPSFFWCL